MANTTMQMVAAYYESKNMKYKIIDEEQAVMRTGFSGLDNCESIETYIFFSENGRYVQIRTNDYSKVPVEKIDKVLRTINALNVHYRWVTFFINEESGEVVVKADAVVDIDTCGSEVLELVSRMATISDEAYPQIMRAIWS